MDAWAVSSFWVLLCWQMDLILLYKYVGLDLVAHRVGVCLFWQETAKRKRFNVIHFPINNFKSKSK